MKKPVEYILTALGITAIIPIYIIFALSIPLSVLAIAHITGWGLWKALIMFGVFSFIPLIQLVVFFAPFFGAYYLIAADFDWSKAAYPNAQIETLNYEKMSDTEYAKYKKDILIPQMTEECKHAMVEKAGFEGKITFIQANYCACFSEKFANQIKKEDLGNYEKGNFPPFIRDEMEKIATECKQ